jgi:hypothetical protein
MRLRNCTCALLTNSKRPFGIDYIDAKSDREYDKAVEAAVKKGELRFHTRNKRTSDEIIPFPGRTEFLKGLLERNIEQRLGCAAGNEGLRTQIMPHQYLEGINWDLVEKKQLVPPYKPEVR